MREGADVRLADVVTEAVIAAKGYDAVARVIEPLQARGITVVIPPRCNRKQQHESDKELYKARHLVENFFAHLKQYPGLVARYDKRAPHLLSALYLFASIIWLI